MKDGRLRRTGTVLSGRQRLERYLVKHRLTQAEGADEFGISRVQLNQYLSGERRPSLEVAVRIEDITSIGVRTWLLEETAESADVVISSSNGPEIHHDVPLRRDDSRSS